MRDFWDRLSKPVPLTCPRLFYQLTVLINQTINIWAKQTRIHFTWLQKKLGRWQRIRPATVAVRIWECTDIDKVIMKRYCVTLFRQEGGTTLSLVFNQDWLHISVYSTVHQQTQWTDSSLHHNITNTVPVTLILWLAPQTKLVSKYGKKWLQNDHRAQQLYWNKD